MSKQPTSKRQWRDGAAPSAKKTAKPFKSKARPKDETRKTHPCLVPYEQLPEEQRRKDAIFIDAVNDYFAKRDE